MEMLNCWICCCSSIEDDKHEWTPQATLQWAMFASNLANREVTMYFGNLVCVKQEQDFRPYRTVANAYSEALVHDVVAMD